MQSFASWYGINGEEGSQKSLEESRTFKSLKDHGDRGIVIEFRETIEIFEGKLLFHKFSLKSYSRLTFEKYLTLF